MDGTSHPDDTENGNDEPDLENPYVQSMMFTDLFRELESCDSKRVDDFWCILQDTTLELLNVNGQQDKGS